MSDYHRRADSGLSPWPAERLLVVHDHELDGSTMSVSVAQATAAVTDRRIDELQPLAEIVNAELLDYFFQPPPVRGATPCSLSFVYEGHPITVTRDGEIQIYAPDAAAVASGSG